MSLTKKQCDAATYSGDAERQQRCVLWDDDPTGLGLRITPNGAKTWVLSYRTGGGTKRLMKLAPYNVMTLDQARTAARTELLAVETQAADPMAQKAARRLDATTGTVRAMFEAYLASRAADRTRPMRTHREVLELAELHIFDRFGSRPWQEVKRSEVRQWHAGFADMPATGNKALRALRAAYYWRLKQSDDLPVSGADTRNPCWGVSQFPETARQVRLEVGQLPDLERAIDKATADPITRAFFRFALATGCRRSEAINLQWSDVRLDPKGATATFRKTKTAASHTVPLSPAARELLLALPRIAGNLYVFAGRKAGQPINGVDKVWNRVRAELGRPELRIHDLRRTFGSWLGDAGFSSKQIGALLGHRTDITSRVYMSLGDASARAAVGAMHDIMTKARSTATTDQNGAGNDEA